MCFSVLILAVTTEVRQEWETEKYTFLTLQDDKREETNLSAMIFSRSLRTHYTNTLWKMRGFFRDGVETRTYKQTKRGPNYYQ